MVVDIKMTAVPSWSRWRVTDGDDTTLIAMAGGGRLLEQETSRETISMWANMRGSKGMRQQVAYSTCMYVDRVSVGEPVPRGGGGLAWLVRAGM